MTLRLAGSSVSISSRRRDSAVSFFRASGALGAGAAHVADQTLTSPAPCASRWGQHSAQKSSRR